eukprot:3296271-Pleurochrysis_carterae.AAC.1
MMRTTVHVPTMNWQLPSSKRSESTKISRMRNALTPPRVRMMACWAAVTQSLASAAADADATAAAVRTASSSACDWLPPSCEMAVSDTS